MRRARRLAHARREGRLAALAPWSFSIAPRARYSRSCSTTRALVALLLPATRRAARCGKVHDRGLTLHCWRRETHPGAPWLLHFHGNGELVVDYVPGFADELAELGWNAAFAEYRGYGGSSGTPSIPAMLDDAETVMSALAVPAERVVAYGRSIGSYAAIELARRHPTLAGLVIESGIADPLERIRMRVSAEDLGVSDAALEAEVARLVDHRAKLGAYRGRLLVLHPSTTPWSTRRTPSAARVERLGRGRQADRAPPQGDHNNVMSANADEYLTSCPFLALVATTEPRPTRLRADRLGVAEDSTRGACGAPLRQVVCMSAPLGRRSSTQVARTPSAFLAAATERLPRTNATVLSPTSGPQRLGFDLEPA